VLMGGRVGVYSRPGAGSTFWAELPLPVAEDDLPEAAPGAQAASDDDGSASLQGRRVLMAEDNAVNMMIAVALLEAWGLQVAQAGDGQEALAAVQTAVALGRPFDVVLMDVQMPRMSGHEATRALRAAGHRLPIIALTAAALVTERDEALRAGMDDFLTKPIDADRLRATLRRWCAAPKPASRPAPEPAGPA
jgi:CheY-like chemotaxis protein